MISVNELNEKSCLNDQPAKLEDSATINLIGSAAVAPNEVLSGASNQNIGFENLVEVQKQLEHFDDDKSNLQKSVSVPHLYSNGASSNAILTKYQGSTRRKKTTEANPLPGADLLARLQHENIEVKETLIKEMEERKSIVNINHAWSEQYDVLSQKFTLLEKDNQQAVEELNIIISNLNKEITNRDKKITHLTKKLEDVIVSSCEENDKSSRENENMSYSDEEWEEKMLILKREQVANQQVKELQLKLQILERSLAQQAKQKAGLKTELHRVSLLIESKHNTAWKTSLPRDEQATLNSTECNKNDVLLLKQQLQMYAEDFQAEKDEKQKLLEENEELKKRIGAFSDEKDHLLRQLQIYEEDFHREREKRIQLMRKANAPRTEFGPTRTLSSGVSTPSPISSEDAQQKWKEYCCLVVEKEQMADRINELEEQGITRYNGRHSAATPYSHCLPRSRPPQSNRLPDLDINVENFYGGEVVSDGWPRPSYSSSRVLSTRSALHHSTSNSPLHHTPARSEVN